MNHFKGKRLSDLCHEVTIVWRAKPRKDGRLILRPKHLDRLAEHVATVARSKHRSELPWLAEPAQDAR
jgi:hypothetical protein